MNQGIGVILIIVAIFFASVSIALLLIGALAHKDRRRPDGLVRSSQSKAIRGLDK